MERLIIHGLRENTANSHAARLESAVGWLASLGGGINGFFRNFRKNSGEPPVYHNLDIIIATVKEQAPLPY